METSAMKKSMIVLLILCTLFSELVLTNPLTDYKQPQNRLANAMNSSSKLLHVSGGTKAEGVLESIVLFEQFLADEKAKLLSPTLDTDNVNAQTFFTNYQETLRNCSSDINYAIEAARRGLPWALEMLDSMGKPSPGILRENNLFVGDFDQCIDVDTGLDFEGQYCTARLLISEIRNITLLTKLTFVQSFCFPSTCDVEDVDTYINAYLLSSPDISAIALDTRCQDRHLTLTTKAKLVICICSIFALLLVIGTFYDVAYKRWWLADKAKGHTASNDKNESGNGHPIFGSDKVKSEREPIIDRTSLKPSHYSDNESAPNRKPDINMDFFDKVLTSFSVYNNTVKLFSTKQSPDSIDCIHGMRFISITWIILLHTYRMGAGALENVRPFLDESLDDWTYMAVIKAVEAVDTFFAMSGLLLTFLVLKKLTKEGPTLKFFGTFYSHRYFRLTIPYMLILMTYVPLFKYISDGPFWPQDRVEIDECRESWWTNLLYLNNFLKFDSPCMGWSWYLACDMQFYLISPLMFLPLFWYEWKGLIVPFLFLLAHAICAGVISSANDLLAVDQNGAVLGITPGMTPEVHDFNKKYYVKPYTRIGPFVIGVVTGFLLFKSECKASLSKLAVTLGWIAAAAMALAVIYGLYDHVKSDELQSTEIRALYNSLHSIAWGLSICWVIFACTNGYGEFVNTLLSWKPLIPLSRLSYCAYLLHPIVIQFYFYSQRKPFYMNHLSLTYVFVAITTLTFAVAYIAYMAYEIPMTELEKVIRGRGKRK